MPIVQSVERRLVLLQQLDATDKLLNNMIEELKSGRWDDYLEWLAEVYNFNGCLRDAFHPKMFKMYQEWLSETM